MKIKLIVFALLLSFCSYGQKYELGEVTKQELEQKSHPLNTSAPAAILFSKGVTYLALSQQNGFELVTEVDMKIKIYTKEGYEWATKEIALYVNGPDKEEVSISKAYTYNLVDGNIKKIKLKSEGEFTEVVNKFWKTKKIIMPDVKEGSILEYRYTIRSPFLSVFPEWKFQEKIPVDYTEYTTKIPEYYVYTPNFRGYYPPKVDKKAENKKFSYTTKERLEGTVVKTEFSNNEIEYKEYITSYVLENLPAMSDERFVSNIENYTSSIEHELSLKRFPNEPMKSYSTTWEDVAKTIYDYDDFGTELKKTGYFEKDIDVLLTGISAPNEKAAVIFNYVKNRMNWNSFYGYSCQDGVKKAYNEKVGNIAEINLMLTAMLRYAGLEANPVLVSTRSHKIALFPNRTAYNYVVAAAEIEGKTVLFDATSKSSIPNILPIRTLNWTGRLIKKDGTSVEINMIPLFNSKEFITIMGQIDNEGKVSGKAREQYYDYNALNFRERYSNADKDKYIENLEEKYKGIQINSYTVSIDDLSKPVTEDYDFTYNNIGDIIGDKIYINPMLFFTQSENPFKQEKREYPIDFVYPSHDKYSINLTIPDGYIVESLPASANISMEENIGGFKYNIAATGNKLQLIMTIDINYAAVSNVYYPTLKDFFQRLIEKQNEKIVLTKNI